MSASWLESLEYLIEIRDLRLIHSRRSVCLVERRILLQVACYYRRNSLLDRAISYGFS